MLPSNWDMQIEDFYELMALANISRELEIEDITSGTNKAIILALDGEAD